MTDKNVSVIKRPNNEITAARSYGGKELQLIRRTVAKDTTEDEFNMFIEICKRQGLDPFRRQIYALVFSKDNAQKRQVSFITGIDGYRAIAKRAGNYRPDTEEPEIEYDEAMKCPHTNPKGIKKATVTVWQYAIDGWYPIKGRALWEEYAPIRQEMEWQEQYDDQGNVILQTEGKWKGKPAKVLKPKPGAQPYLEKETWKKMPEIMIAKCAEAQALRKGWPEEIGGLYTEDEFDKVKSDIIASEEVAAYEEEKRMRAVNAVDSVPMIINATDGLQMIEVGKVFDTVVAHIRDFEDADQIEFWKDQNRVGLQQYWGRCPSDAFELKKEIEKQQSKLRENVKEVSETSDDVEESVDNSKNTTLL